MPTAVEVKHLVKRYGGRAVVDGLSFSVDEGEVFALLGPNGAGKTTTVEILEGYRKPDAGTVRVLGLDPVRSSGTLRPCIGLMLQQGGLYPQITPVEALWLFAAFYPKPDAPETWLDRLGLREVANTRFRNLSVGQKQRLALGIALVGRPRLVFLDEPTAGMDPQARQVTWSIIRDLREHGTTVVLTTHFMDEAEQLANRVAIIDRGGLVALDSPTRLRRSARNEVRVTTQPPIAESEIANALAIPRAAVVRENDGSLLLAVEPTPALVGQLAAALAERGVLLTDLRAGSRSLEEAFLDLTDSSQP